MWRDAVVPLIVAEAQCEIRLHRVHPAVLQPVRTDFAEESDPPVLLAEIEHDPVVHLSDGRECRLQLVAAVATQRADRITGEALRVKAQGVPFRPVTSSSTKAACSLPSRLFQNATTWYSANRDGKSAMRRQILSFPTPSQL